MSQNKEEFRNSSASGVIARGDEEEAVFVRTKDAFLNYEENAVRSEIEPRVAATERLGHGLKAFAQERVAPHTARLRRAITANKLVCDKIADTFVSELAIEAEPTPLDDSKVLSTLRQLSREWSEDGRKERLESYGRLLYALNDWFPEESGRRKIKVLVPGSGLGRLPFEISLMGFSAVGNEFSTHMILVSQAILNSCLEKNEWTIYPYIHSHSHWRTRDDQLRPVHVPDIAMYEPQLGEMSMAMGDLFDFALSEAYAGSFQAVVTSFFIDAPFDFFKTLDALTHVTEAGGIWVNFGPLHWHSDISGVPDGGSGGIELSLDDVIAAVELKGWTLLEHESGIRTTYCSTHPLRMGRMIFECEYWMAQKTV